MPLSTQVEIQESYCDPSTAKQYVEDRFVSELMRLLHERQVAAIQEVMNANRPTSALEIAPGPGRVTRDVTPAGRLVCLEFNKGMIDEGERACRNGAEWFQGDAFDLPFGEEFDFVYSYRFVRHFQRPDRDRLYRQISKVLKPGGMLVLDAVNEAVSGPLRRAKPDDYPIYDHLYANEDELRTELKEAGFTVVRCQAVQRRFPLQLKAQILLGPRNRWLCRAAIRSLELLSRGPGLEWIVTACRA